MAKQFVWRVATEEEIEKGLDHQVNKGMVIVEEIEVPDQIIEENV